MTGTSFPPLELHAEIDTADGLAQYRWDCNAAVPEDRPQRMVCGSTLMNGFANASCALARNVNGQFGDLGLYDTIRFVGVDGDIAYEWTVRAGQTIELPEDDVNPIRLVHEASWDQDGRTLTINADASSETIDAIVSDMSAS